MDVGARQVLHDEQTSDCRSFGSNIRSSSQTRKISIGVMADSKTSTRNGLTMGDGIVVPNTEREISIVGNFPGEKNEVKGVTPSFNIKHSGGPPELKCSWISKSFYQRTPISESIIQANQASSLLVSPGGGDDPNGIERAAGKHSVQLFSYQKSTLTSNNFKKFDADAARIKGRKDEPNDKVKEFTFATVQQVFESEKTYPEDKVNRTENRTENLRMKLCQILGTTSSHKSRHSASPARNNDEESLPPEQRSDQKQNMKSIQNSDTIETDSENPDHALKRPVTRSWSRKKTSSKKQPGKGKSGPSSKKTEKQGEKSIFSFKGKQIGRRDDFPDDGSLRKKNQKKNSMIGKNKTSVIECDTADKLHQHTSKTDLPLNDQTTFSLGKIAGGYTGCLPEYQSKCPHTEKINQEKEFYEPTIVNTDQHGELEVSENENQKEYKSNPVNQNVASKLQDDFPSPTFQLKTPILSFSPDSTQNTGRKEKDVSSPASTERTFSLGSIHSLRNIEASEPDFNIDGLGEQMQPSDIEETNSFIPRKDKSSETEKKEQGGLSDSSSEDLNFQEHLEGSRERRDSERKNFVLHPMKRLCKHESIKFNNRSPASASSKGTGDSDWIGEASEQNQNGFARAVELLALELGKLQSKLKSMTSQKSSEILKSVAEEIHLQLQNVHSQIQTDMGKLTNLSKSKRKRLETRFEDQQQQLRLTYDRFKEEVNQHLQDCRSTIEDLEADQIEIKRAMEKQRVAHKKLLSQVEEAMEIQLDDAQRKIRVTQEKARGKLLQLKQVVAMCLKEEILN
ncbi:meiosis-specific protein ASY3 [Vigna radiata var. radiata]|uniref:Meiosis-specific protein ASY3 n=1 Tax=Vigna radiata var. radiata TaxID=3916 RepID=A0A3Q0EPM1_VIGRR|nr:meiosis-specific protein ASY3 [Vigna radiata var. radiata]